MKPKKRKKKYRKYLVLVLVFLAILGGTLAVAIITKTQREARYEGMKPASLPMIRLSCLNGLYEAELHGYVQHMDERKMRDLIVPLSEDRGIDVLIDRYENSIHSLQYELRSLDGSQFLDGGSVDLQKESTDSIRVSLSFSQLLESGIEYQLLLIAETAERPVYFYTRVIYARTQYAEELLNFVREFSDATLDREKAAAFLVNYIQPEADSNSTDYSYTDIHSKYSMLTYGTMEVVRTSEPILRIQELEPTQASVSLSYTIQMPDGQRNRSCQVQEFFCVRYRSEKVYLLDYYRTIDEIFNVESASRENGRILLGISNEAAQIRNSDNNDYTVFVENRNIWSFNSKTNAMSLIFSFSDETDHSNRSSYDHHDMQVVKVSDDGTIDYMVYGYMNRGNYEGMVGICFYRYSTSDNSTKRLFFMPVQQSEQMLMMDLGTLAYVNDSDVCYLRYGDGIYSIDLGSGESVEVSIRAYPGAYAMNNKGNVVAWQEGDDLKYPERLVILNMDSQTTAVVNAPDQEFVKILDFIGDDIVYGFGRAENSVIEANMDMRQLLSHLVIASTDEELKIQQEYIPDGCFILSADVLDTRIAIRQGQKTREGTLKLLEDKILLLTQDVGKNKEKSMLMSRETEPVKKEYYIQLGKVTAADSQFSSVIPRFAQSDDVNVIDLLHNQTGAYYVYGYGRLLYVESEINRAIDEAFSVFGVVVDDEMNYLWTRGTRDLFKTISIQPYRAKAREETLAVSLQILAAQEGIQLPDVKEDLERGLNPFEILDAALGENSSVNLYGCSVQEVLYFINQGHPVMAVTGNRDALVITGYERQSVSVYFPYTGETVNTDMSAAESYFRDYGNCFISYKR